MRLTGGQGTAWRSGNVVLKPLDMTVAELAWQAEVLGSLACDGFRVARPLAAGDGSLVVDGWTARQALEGSHREGCWPEVIAVGERFHAALAATTRPGFLDLRSDRWAIGDRVAWGELPAEEFSGVKHVPRLVAALQPLDASGQIVHGDLTGNVLFSDELPPAVIDFVPYWRPPGFASAVVVADALVWEGADETLLGSVAHVDEFPQYLLRALIYRAVTDRLFRLDEPLRADDDDPYLPAVELALGLAG